MWQDTTTSDGGTDELIKLLVSTDRELQVSRSDSLNPEIFRRVT